MTVANFDKLSFGFITGRQKSDVQQTQITRTLH